MYYHLKKAPAKTFEQLFIPLKDSEFQIGGGVDSWHEAVGWGGNEAMIML